MSNYNYKVSFTFETDFDFKLEYAYSRKPQLEEVKKYITEILENAFKNELTGEAISNMKVKELE